jgi:shikimate dehydrogenase
MDFRSDLVGCFSVGSNGNPSVEMVEAAFRHHDINFRYINCEVTPENLGAAVAGAKAMGWIGFNCSIPHKIEVIKYLDGLGESAKIIGAVNCTVLRDGKFIGENTDGKGFLASLQAVTNPTGKSVVIFGAGGAARAVAVEVALAGAKSIVIVNRDFKRGQELAELINSKTKSHATHVHWTNTFKIPESTDIVVNATSIGMSPNRSARLELDTNSLQPNMIVADVVIDPPLTHLIQDAQAKGCTVLNGFGMLVNQGILGIKFWTGIDVDPEPMHERLRQLV